MATRYPFHGPAGADAADAIRAALHRGGVVGFPTESTYALGVDPFQEAAVRRLYTIKGREEHKPILVLIGDRAELHRLIRDVPVAAAILMDEFWPGPLTLIFPAGSTVPCAATAGTGTIGIRLPAYDELRGLLRVVGPLTGTSANRSGQPGLTTADAVEDAFGADIDIVLDGTARGAPSSTVVQTDGEIRIVRAGAIPAAAVAAALRRHGLAVSSLPTKED
jgi:L-threonylcarbamoyladenylate synthase